MPFIGPDFRSVERIGWLTSKLEYEKCANCDGGRLRGSSVSRCGKVDCRRASQRSSNNDFETNQSLRRIRLGSGGSHCLACQTTAAAQNCAAAAAPGVNWQECDKKLLILEGQDLSGANLFGVDFTSTDLRKQQSSLRQILRRQRLCRASLADIDRQRRPVRQNRGLQDRLQPYGRAGAVFASAEVQRSNFQDANLTKVDFTKAELGRAQFHDADISGSRFSFANLARADFRGAMFTAPIDFDGAFFFQTRIEGLDLSNSTGRPSGSSTWLAETPGPSRLLA